MFHSFNDYEEGVERLNNILNKDRLSPREVLEGEGLILHIWRYEASLYQDMRIEERIMDNVL